MHQKQRYYKKISKKNDATRYNIDLTKNEEKTIKTFQRRWIWLVMISLIWNWLPLVFQKCFSRFLNDHRLKEDQTFSINLISELNPVFVKTGLRPVQNMETFSLELRWDAVQLMNECVLIILESVFSPKSRE